jgi:hypothetical protein
LELYGPGVTHIPVQPFAAEAPAEWEPQVDRTEHDEHAWCTFDDADQRLFLPGESETLRDLRATLGILRERLLSRGPKRTGPASGDR